MGVSSFVNLGVLSLEGLKVFKFDDLEVRTVFILEPRTFTTS